MKKSHELDMTCGSLMPKMLAFAVPVILSGLLQLLFNAADLVVVGRFAGSDALAQVGATGAITRLIVNLFVGMSVGANVVMAHSYGAKDAEGISDTVHTTMLFALLGGLVIGVAGFVLAPTLLRLMGTPADILDGAVLYMRIILIGAPITCIYNYGASVLRAVGDTRRPLYFLTAAGILNVLLNLFFVIVLHMAVAGVALATVLSQALSMVLVVRTLMTTDADYKLLPKKLRIHGGILARLLRIGVPAGIQSCLFSISNVVVQSALNTFGSVTISGVTAANSVEGFMFCAVDAFNHAATAAISQNMGARNYDRVRLVVRTSTVLVVAVSLILSTIFLLLRSALVSIYASDPAVIEAGAKKLLISMPIYFFGGLMNMMAGVNRGLGYSMLPTTISLLGACVFRLIWIWTIFAWTPTFFILYVSYPISWILTTAAHYISYFVIRQRAFEKNDALLAAKG